MKKIFKSKIPPWLAGVTTCADKLLLFFLVILSASGVFFIRSLFPSGTLVKIYADDKIAYVLPLGEDQVVSVGGALGRSLVEIKDKKVRMKDSPCPRKICVHQGWTDRGVITCLPNQVMIAVQEDGQDIHNEGYDAVTK